MPFKEGDEIGKGLWARTRTGVAWSTMAQHVGVLLMRLC